MKNLKPGDSVLIKHTGFCVSSYGHISKGEIKEISTIEYSSNTYVIRFTDGTGGYGGLLDESCVDDNLDYCFGLLSSKNNNYEIY